MINGTDVRLDIFAPDLTNPIAIPEVATVGPGVEFSNPMPSTTTWDVVEENFDLYGSRVDYTITDSFYRAFANVDDTTGFNGYVLSFLDLPTAGGVSLFTAEIIDNSTTLAISQDEIWVEQNKLFVNVDGLGFQFGDTIDLRLGFDINGTNGADRLAGDFGNDRLAGFDGRDYLFGDRGIDALRGGRGQDTLDGGRANDRLFGDAGADTFILRDQGVDRVLDFEKGLDRIQVETGADNFDDLALFQRPNGVAAADGYSRIFLAGVTVDEVEASWFVF